MFHRMKQDDEQGKKYYTFMYFLFMFLLFEKNGFQNKNFCEPTLGDIH